MGTRSVIEAKKTHELLNLDKVPFVCYSGVPDDFIRNADEKYNKNDGGKTKILYVGGLVANKHITSIIQAISMLEKEYRSHISLEIVGSGPQGEELKELASTLLQDMEVLFTGRLPRNEVTIEMKNSNIFVMISEGETFGMVYLEAMLQGCIVIASKDGGFDGIIETGKNGFLCPPGDADSLAIILDEIIKMDETEKKRIGQEAINTAMNFSESEVAKKYLEDILARQKT